VAKALQKYVDTTGINIFDLYMKNPITLAAWSEFARGSDQSPTARIGEANLIVTELVKQGIMNSIV